MPVKPNRTDLQNYVPPGRPGGGEYASGTAEKGTIPKEQMKTTTITQELKDKIAIMKNKQLNSSIKQKETKKPNELTMSEKISRYREQQDTNNNVVKTGSFNDIVERIKKVGIQEVSFDEATDKEFMKSAVETLEDTFKEYPDLKNYIRNVGSSHRALAKDRTYFMEAYAKAKGRKLMEGEKMQVISVFEKVRLPNNAPAGYYKVGGSSIGVSITGIMVDASLFNSDRYITIIKSGMDAGYTTKGDNIAKTVIDHEIGHAITNMLDLKNNTQIIKYYNQGEANKISRYAQSSISEFIAEAWAEFRNNKNPSDISKKIGGIVNEEYIRKNR